MGNTSGGWRTLVKSGDCSLSDLAIWHQSLDVANKWLLLAYLVQLASNSWMSCGKWVL